MPDDGKVSFCIVASFSSPTVYSRSYFVRADSLPAAYAQLVSRPEFSHPHVTLSASVLDASELRDVLPAMKAVAHAYWVAGRRIQDPNHDSTFDELWDEHGPSLVDEED